MAGVNFHFIGAILEDGMGSSFINISYQHLLVSITFSVGKECQDEEIISPDFRKTES